MSRVKPYHGFMTGGWRVGRGRGGGNLRLTETTFHIGGKKRDLQPCIHTHINPIRSAGSHITYAHAQHVHVHVHVHVTLARLSPCPGSDTPFFLFGAALSLAVFVGIQQHVLTGAVAEAQAVLLEQLDVPLRLDAIAVDVAAVGRAEVDDLRPDELALAPLAVLVGLGLLRHAELQHAVL